MVDLKAKLHRPQLSPEDRQALERFWAVYSQHYEETTELLRNRLADHLEFGPVIKSMTAEQIAQQNRQGRQRAERAFGGGEWEPYLTYLHNEGVRYAHIGISYSSWFEAIALFRRFLIPYLIETYRDDLDQLESSLRGMSLFMDIIVPALSEAYLGAMEETILQQQQAIRELSTPVLQVRERLLILPIVGLIDTHRAREITQTLLQAIRAHRARMIVIDITGVPVVDSQVANYLIQTVDAARLMGANSILTGLSPEVAQTLVAVGVNLRSVTTMGDLQSGLEVAERRLGYQVVRHDAPWEEAGR